MNRNVELYPTLLKAEKCSVLVYAETFLTFLLWFQL